MYRNLALGQHKIWHVKFRRAEQVDAGWRAPREACSGDADFEYGKLGEPTGWIKVGVEIESTQKEKREELKRQDSERARASLLQSRLSLCPQPTDLSKNQHSRQGVLWKQYGQS